MDSSLPPPRTHAVDLFLIPTTAHSTLHALLHLILFQRLFVPARPRTHTVLNTTLPFLDDPDIDALLASRCTALLRSLDDGSSLPPGSVFTVHDDWTDNAPAGNSRITLALSFYERRRRKTYSFFGKAGNTDELVCWERWEINVTMARPRDETEADKVAGAVERSLDKAARRVVLCSMDRDQIPPITSTEGNPFPWDVVIAGGNGAGLARGGG